jgi:hypothetical protein
MLASKTNKFNRLYIFSAKIIYIPTSFNRVGVDPLPRFYVQPLELQQYLRYSVNPQSRQWGYDLDKRSGFYVQNIENVDIAKVTDQLDWIKLNPPFWFFNEGSYESFLEQNFDPERSQVLESKYKAAAPGINVASDGTLPQHYYVETTEWIGRDFRETEVVEWPKEKNSRQVPLSGGSLAQYIEEDPTL